MNTNNNNSYKENMDKVIFHCDMDNFFASVELIDFPQYKDSPVAVAGDPSKRSGIILAKNTIAKNKGIKTAETIWSAKQKCPELILLPSNHHKYKEYSKAVLDIYYQYTDLIEPFSIDEAWLDVTGVMHIYNSPEDLAKTIKEHIKSELNLSLSIGISNNKFFSKMGSSFKKPYGTVVVSNKNFLNLFGSKPVSEMFFVGKSTAKKLNSIGCKTIKDIYNLKLDFLKSFLGKHGETLYKYTHGLSDNHIASIFDKRDVKSIGHSMTFSKDLTSSKEVKLAILTLSQKVAYRLRKHNLHSYGVKIDIKDYNFKIKTKQTRLIEGTNSAEKITEVAFNLYKELWLEGYPIRLISITALSLTEDNKGIQMSLFDNKISKSKTDESIEKTLDLINKKFGKNSIYLASLMKDEFETKDDSLVINRLLDDL